MRGKDVIELLQKGFLGNIFPERFGQYAFNTHVEALFSSGPEVASASTGRSSTSSGLRSSTTPFLDTTTPIVLNNIFRSNQIEYDWTYSTSSSNLRDHFS